MDISDFCIDLRSLFLSAVDCLTIQCNFYHDSRNIQSAWRHVISYDWHQNRIFNHRFWLFYFFNDCIHRLIQRGSILRGKILPSRCMGDALQLLICFLVYIEADDMSDKVYSLIFQLFGCTARVRITGLFAVRDKDNRRFLFGIL